MKKIAAQARLSAPRPRRTTSPAMIRPIAQPNSIITAKNGMIAQPRAPMIEKWKIGIARMRGPADADQDAHQADQEVGDHQLAGPQGADEQVAEVAGVHLLEEAHGDAELAAKQRVPEEDRGQEHAGRLRHPARLADQELGDEAPQDHLHGRPIDQVQQARPGAEQQIGVPVEHRPDAAQGRRERHATGSGRRRSRAMSRNTSSRSSRP